MYECMKKGRFFFINHSDLIFYFGRIEQKEKNNKSRFDSVVLFISTRDIHFKRKLIAIK